MRHWASLVGVAVLAGATGASAQEGPRSAAELYQQGARLLQERKPAEALAALDASLGLQKSANTALVRAHALRLLGRRCDAIDAYGEVVRDAGDRLRAGDDRARDTLADAGRWATLLRAEVGEVSVEVARAVEGTTLSIDGKATPLAREAGGVARARACHEPGRATISVRTPGGEERSATADLPAGGTGSVRLELATPGEAPASVAGGGSPPVGTWVSWGAGVAGLGLFAAFGAMARGVSAELDKCAPSCAPSLRGDAANGKRDALVANVSLAVGGAGLVTGAVLWIVSSRAARAQPVRGAQAFVGVAPGGASLGVAGTF